MILDNQTHHTVEARRQKLDTLAAIEALPSGAEKWRAAQRFMFKLNPELVAYDQVHIAAVKEIRMEQRSRTGSSKSGDMRALYSMPEYLYRTLEMIDPEFKSNKMTDPVEAKRLNHKVWRAFPEYRLAEVL